jgi:hypothetical protein
MKKIIVLSILSLSLVGLLGFANNSEARGHYGSFRIGGYTSSGKGSHYIGGYVRSTHTLKYYLTH